MLKAAQLFLGETGWTKMMMFEFFFPPGKPSEPASNFHTAPPCEDLWKHSQSHLSSFQNVFWQSSAPTDADNCKTSFVTMTTHIVTRKTVSQISSFFPSFITVCLNTDVKLISACWYNMAILYIHFSYIDDDNIWDFKNNTYTTISLLT